MNEWMQKTIEAALEARVGMQEPDAAKLAAFNAQQTDWYGVCQKCGKHLTGTMQELKDHICD